ncbi:Aste57867_302 [Aphanomyces stellatus]|uniref:Aste57867_302 protein n=1 Tax=Aphanomyces stellatus TaxID=120398 RepID=A0A485K2G8_9STRA|nr:hypothetical protein As57867_000302 [Aphanomyces stellatus]VFT77528.1 Aste57867_302 [Aphanomyces stellatus]
MLVRFHGLRVPFHVCLGNRRRHHDQQSCVCMRRRSRTDDDDTSLPGGLGDARSRPLKMLGRSSLDLIDELDPIFDNEIKANLTTIPLADWHSRLWYLVDSFISGQNQGQAVLLILLCLVIAFGLAPIENAVAAESYSNSVWRVWTYMTDTGTQNHATTHPQMAVAFFLTLIGFMYFAVVVGFVVDNIRDKMERLKHGRTQVVEFNHTLVLGWSDKSAPYIQEICHANAGEGGGVIVVLAEQSREEMVADLASHHTHFQGTHVVFRSGNPLLTADLNMVSAQTARSICVMSTSRDAGKSDASLLRTILAINSLPELNGHVVADTSDIDNEPLLELVGGDALESLVSNDVMGRLLVMCSRSPGLAKVFTALLGFSGNEFYVQEWPACVGVPFGELAARFPAAIPLGVKDAHGQVLLAPPMTRKMQPGDALIVLAEDKASYQPVEGAPVASQDIVAATNDVIAATDDVDDHVWFEDDAIIADNALRQTTPNAVTAHPQKVLICGWRRDIRDILRLLNTLSPPGSEIHLLNEEPASIRNALLLEDGLDVHTLDNVSLVHHEGNPAVRRHVLQVHLDAFDSYMVVSDAKREGDVLESDSHVLSAMLMLRSVEFEQGKRRVHKLFGGKVAKELVARHQVTTPCIAEMLDPRTQKTIEENHQIGQSSDFVQTNELISRMLAMVSENRLVKQLLDELLSGRGAALDVVPATRYCTKTERLSFHDLVLRAQARGDIVCGYQTHDSLAPTTLNPPNKHKVRTTGWHTEDLVLLREGRRERQLTQMQSVCQAFWDALHRRESRHHIDATCSLQSFQPDDKQARHHDASMEGTAHRRLKLLHTTTATHSNHHVTMLHHPTVHARVRELWDMADEVQQVATTIHRVHDYGPS